MRNHWLFLIKIGLLFLLLLAKSCDGAEENITDPASQARPLVLLISIDGFSIDYLQQFSTPTLDSLAQVGISADALIPVFPSKTFPNHYTQVTGLYPRNHGIISNRMYDREFDEYFTIGTQGTASRDGKWYQGEPIWVTASKQKLITATMFWPGSEAEIMGARPHYYFPFNGDIPESERVVQVITWIETDLNPPNLITLYFEQVDQAGHLHGPYSGAVEDVVAVVDEHLNDLFNGIKKLGKIENLNIIVVSDHGMAEISRDRVIFLDEYISLDQIEVVNWSPVLEIIPLEGTEKIVYDQLKGAHRHLQVYRKDNTPENWHFDKHRRITPIIGLADPGWSVSSKRYFEEHPNAYTGGTHGYDPLVPSMHGIFIATGPGFRSGFKIGPVESVHLYELLCELLGIIPAPNDGNLRVWEKALQ